MRDYQLELANEIISSTTNDFIQCATGSGKTRIIVHTIKSVIAHYSDIYVVAHRDSIVKQISVELEKAGISVKIIAGNANLSNRFNDHSSKIKVCSVSTLRARGVILNDSLIIIDEAHHAITKNQWGKIVGSGCRVIGFSATPTRLDNEPLAKTSGGLFDRLVQSKIVTTYSDFVVRSILCDFSVYSLPNDINFSKLRSGKTGDYMQNSLVDAVSRECVVGSFVKEWLRLAKNKKTLVFCPSVENAKEISARYREIGVSSTHISSKQTLATNERNIKAFENGEATVLVNVEMITEGYDLPAIECLQILRPTQSIVLHKQILGRALRASEGKKEAVILDHVGNCISIGMPDADIQWSLEAPPLEAKKPMYACKECGFVNSLYNKKCSACGSFNHLLHDADWQNDPFVIASYIDEMLVRKERNKIALELEREQLEVTRIANQIKLETELLPMTWRFDDNLVGRKSHEVCLDFIDKSKENGVEIFIINKMLQAPRPSCKFIVDNLAGKSATMDREKCKKVIEKWLAH